MLRRGWPTVGPAACAFVLAGLSRLALDRVSAEGLYGAALDTPVRVGEIALTREAGRRYRTGAESTCWFFFSFTRCPDVCPLTLGRLARTHRDLRSPKPSR